MYQFSLLIKPAGPDCNLTCAHCFYSAKLRLFAGSIHRMPHEIIDTLIHDYMTIRLSNSSFCWSGGEPTLMGLDFFEKVVELQKKYGLPGQSVSNALQTNGTLLDDQWCKFLSRYNFLVGISLDGPKEYHDHYRNDAAGQGSFQSVMRAVKLCRKHKTEFNILTLLTDRNVNQPEIIYEFLLNQNITYMQFIPCIEKQNGQITAFSITPEQYGSFLCRIFDLWIKHDPRKVSIRCFDSLMMYLLHGHQSVCTFSKKCNDYVVVEHNGDVFPCDFFVEDEWRLGNIAKTPIAQIVASDRKRSFADLKFNISNRCFVCRHFALCRGGCLKERIILNNNFRDKSFFCQSYQMFFDYAVPKLMQVLPNTIRRMI